MPKTSFLPKHLCLSSSFFGTMVVLIISFPALGQNKADLAVDSINYVGKEIAGYDFYPEQEHKKFISIHCNLDELTVAETTSSNGMPVNRTVYKLAFKDISLRFPLTLQAHNYKEVFTWLTLGEDERDTFMNSKTDFVYLNFLPSFQKKEMAEKLDRLSPVLTRNVLYLAYTKILAKITNGRMDSIHTVLRDNQKIRLDFAKAVGGVPLDKLQKQPELEHWPNMAAGINSLINKKYQVDETNETEALPLEIYFQITRDGKATNIYTNRKVFWFYDFLEGQQNRYEIMNYGGTNALFHSIKNTVGYTDLATLNAITELIANLKFTPGVFNNENVETVHKITIRPN